MTGFCKALLQMADKLNNVASQLMLIRVLNQKDMLENIILTKHSDKSHPSAQKWRNELTIRLIEAVRPWSDSHCPEGRFNNDIYAKEWDNVDWDDERSLITIEDDCRSLCFLIQLVIYKTKTDEVDEDLLLYLHSKATILHGIASLITGHWYAKWPSATERTKGNLKKEFTKVGNIRSVFELLQKTKGKVSYPLLKKAVRMTGRSERRVREYIAEIKGNPNYTQLWAATDEDVKTGRRREQ